MRIQWIRKIWNIHGTIYRLRVAGKDISHNGQEGPNRARSGFPRSEWDFSIIVASQEYIIPALKKAEYITQDDKTYGVPIVYGPYGLAYNTSLVQKEPKSWNVFWEKKYAGAYIISSDYHEPYC